PLHLRAHANMLFLNRRTHRPCAIISRTRGLFCNVLLRNSELRRQRRPDRRRRHHSHQGPAPPRTPLRLTPHPLRHPPVHRRLRLARPRRLRLSHHRAQHGSRLHALRPGPAPIPHPAQRDPLRSHRPQPPPHVPV